MIPNPGLLLEKLEISLPILAVYDAPNAQTFEPLVQPKPGNHHCIFSFYQQWLKGKTLQLTAENFGCGGCGRAIFNRQTREREEFLTFLADEEGLKASKELVARWLDYDKPYQPKHGSVFIGPIREDVFEYVVSLIFFVNPDQLSGLMIGAQYHAAPEDPMPPVIAPFGAGCMQVLPLFRDLNFPQAIIGSTDIAMRQYFPKEIMTFSVTVPMYKRLCELDERSFLFKPFLNRLKEARKKKTSEKE